ncbi:hypothetical protein MMC09_002876 [Bachmanniomyces sp. S44760]|nr:hypothetical protein [Bachmanniomyces sp. S44760]
MSGTIPAAKKVGIIVCSQRVPRAGLQITEFVLSTIKSQVNLDAANVTLSLIDLAAWDLPMFNEPGVPSQMTSADQYTHAHTRAWSNEISSCDAFVFTTPQYNWSLPASLKNAIDYLFNEWKGKPGLIISYGGHGGGKCAAHLNEIMQGIRMRPTERMVQLAFPSREDQVKAVTGKDLGLSAEDEGTMWADKRKEIVTGFEELVAMLEK